MPPRCGSASPSLVREILVGVTIAVATIVFGMERFDVSWWGKLATALLMFAIPGFMLGSSDIAGNDLFQIASWILGIPGLILSWITAIGYVPKIRAGVAAGRAARARDTRPWVRDERPPLPTSIRLPR